MDQAKAENLNFVKVSYALDRGIPENVILKTIFYNDFRRFQCYLQGYQQLANASQIAEARHPGFTVGLIQVINNLLMVMNNLLTIVFHLRNHNHSVVVLSFYGALPFMLPMRQERLQTICRHCKSCLSGHAMLKRSAFRN